MFLYHFCFKMLNWTTLVSRHPNACLPFSSGAIFLNLPGSSKRFCLQLFLSLPAQSSRWQSKRGTVFILPHPPTYQQNRKIVDSAMCLLFSGTRMGFPRLLFQNGCLGVENTRKEAKIIVCIYMAMQYSEAQGCFLLFFF